ncbi:MAG: sigma 54-interacting transcriptional regulator, partial [Acetobacterium sp.]|nr:sigma 54-interacting transcriptional regulator [Acetobacterium sp.]
VEINYPVFWISEEKYCMRLKEKACAAVPIRSKNGRVVGVLGVATDQDGLSGSARSVYDSLVLLGMAVECRYQQFEMEMFFEREKNSLKLVLGEITEGVVITDKNGLIVDVNKSFGALSGLDVSDAIGKHIKAAFPQAAFAFARDFPGLIYNKKDNCRKSPAALENMQIKNLEFECAGGAQEFCVHIVKKRPETIKPARTLIEGNLFKAGFVFDDIIGESPEIKEIKNLALNIAREDYEILIEGKTGTGKEMFAQAIHNASSRAGGPLVAINCGAVPEELIESELFGYEGGAFTGARPTGVAGKFELANGGTLFFDEIGEMSLSSQVKLLRVLQEKKFMKVGGRCPISVDVRVISATNRNIENLVKEGLFREDLFWRLNVLKIHIPTLLERRQDIPILIEHFLRQHSVERGVHYRLSSRAYDIMQKYNWPGNVRELQNSLKRAVVFAGSHKILPEHLPEQVVRNEGIQLTNLPLHDAEKRIIIEAISSNSGNLSKAARVLGISRVTLYKKIKKYDIIC